MATYREGSEEPPLSEIVPERDPRLVVVDGRYEVMGEIGRGGLGVVYAAREVSLSRDVALEMVGAEWAHDPEILVDHDLPTENEDDEAGGVELVHALRGRPDGWPVRVIACASVLGLRVSQFRFSLLGVRSFLTKPIALGAFVDMLGAASQGAGWRDREAERPEG